MHDEISMYYYSITIANIDHNLAQAIATRSDLYLCVESKNISLGVSFFVTFSPESCKRYRIQGTNNSAYILRNHLNYHIPK